MKLIDRRQFLKLTGAAGAASTLTLAGCAGAGAHAGGARVVVIGGGPGGATAAKYIRMLDPSVNVTLIDSSPDHITCFMSNWVLGGLRSMESITQNFDGLASKHGVKVIVDTVTAIDADAKKVKTAGGQTLAYDRCIVSPGIDFKYDAIEGYSAAAAEQLPHAWKAGPQTVLLRKQMESMKDGGVFVMVAPPNPYRCPPGPYERAGLVAHYLKTNKPKSKIIILDAKDKFSKQGLFMAGWEKLYPGMIEWRSKSNDGLVQAVDVKGMRAMTEFSDIKADVINVIPHQRAGNLAQTAGLTDEAGWCPVNQATWESKTRPGVHVIGDSAIAGAMPKSAYAANSQAKVCAAAVVALLAGKEPPTPSWVNTCYSLVGPQYGISVAGIYTLSAEGVVVEVKDSGGVTPKDGNTLMESIYAESWYNNIIDDMYA